MILFCTVLNAVKVNLPERCLVSKNFLMSVAEMSEADGQGERMPIHILTV